VELVCGPAAPLRHVLDTIHITILASVVTLVVDVGITILAHKEASSSLGEAVKWSRVSNETIVTEDLGRRESANSRNACGDNCGEVNVQMTVEELGVATHLTLHHPAIHLSIAGHENTGKINLLSGLAAVTPVLVNILALLTRRQVALADTIDHDATTGRASHIGQTADRVAINAVLRAGPVGQGVVIDKGLTARIFVAIGESIKTDEVAVTGLVVEELGVILWIADAVGDNGIAIDVTNSIIVLSPEKETVKAIRVGKARERAVVVLVVINDIGPFLGVNLRANVERRRAEEVGLLATIVRNAIAIGKSGDAIEDAATGRRRAIRRRAGIGTITDELVVPGGGPNDMDNRSFEGVLKRVAIEREGLREAGLGKKVRSDGVHIVLSTLAPITPVAIEVLALSRIADASVAHVIVSVNIAVILREILIVGVEASRGLGFSSRKNSTVHTVAEFIQTIQLLASQFKSRHNARWKTITIGISGQTSVVALDVIGAAPHVNEINFRRGVGQLILVSRVSRGARILEDVNNARVADEGAAIEAKFGREINLEEDKR